MSQARKLLVISTIIFSIALSGCSSTQVKDLVQVAVTAVDSLQQAVLGTPTPTFIILTATPSPLVPPGTSTPRNILPATWTPVSLSSSGSQANKSPTPEETGQEPLSYTLEPSTTPTPSHTQKAGASPNSPQAVKTEIVSKSGCSYKAYFEHVDIPSWTCYPIGKEFVTRFKIKNTGTCTWTPDFTFKFVKGDQLSRDSMVPLTFFDEIRPGGTVDVSVWMKLPRVPGYYTGYWMILGDGKVFGWFWTNVITYKKGVMKCPPTPKP